MYRHILIIIVIIVANGASMYAQWQVQQAPRLATMTSAHFVSADTGFAVGSSAGFLTTDGGLKWRDRAPLGNSIYFPTKSTGYCAGMNISKTTDGGMSWRNIRRHPEAEREYTSVHFVDDTIGVAVGVCFIKDGHRSFEIVRTTDGGNQWTPVDFLGSGWPFGCPGPVFFLGASRGYFVDYVIDPFSISYTWFSTDRGLTWGFSDLDLMWGGFFHFRIKSMCFSDSNTMWVGGARDTIRSRSEMKNKRVFRTQNANDTGELVFDTVSYVFPYTVNTITFADSLRGFIGDEKGNIYSTSDGGTTWKNDNVPSDGRSINSICVAGGTRVFAVGDGGLILRYDLPVSVQEPNTSPPLRLYPNPTTGRVRVNIGDNDQSTITIIDMIGRSQDVARVSTNELDVSMLPTGTYIVVVHRGTQVSTEMLVKAGE